MSGSSSGGIGGGGAVKKEHRGFAAMSKEKQREIASRGGRAAHDKGTAHEWTPEEARVAGRKGGQASRGGRGRIVQSPTPSPEGVVPPPVNDLGGREDDQFKA